jgi:hypothetical protein
MIEYRLDEHRGLPFVMGLGELNLQKRVVMLTNLLELE